MQGRFLGKYPEVVKCLKTHLPLAFPISIRKVTIKDADHVAYCTLEESGKKKKFKIRLDKRLSEDALILTLLHEYAHALSWTFQNQDLDDHGPEWGIAYSRVWICFEKNYLHA